MAGLPTEVNKLLADIQKALFERALAFRRDHTFETSDYAEFKAGVENGFVLSHWCGAAACEEKIKGETKATLRCVPLEQTTFPGRCIVCGQPAQERAYFAKAY
jgi:prolyl-tRNA synthetase